MNDQKALPAGNSFKSLSETNIFNPTFGADPFSFYKKALAIAPVLYLEASDTWLVTNAEIITDVCRQPDIFSSDISSLLAGTHSDNQSVKEILDKGWPQVPVLLMSDPPHHNRFRRLVGLAFSAPRIDIIESDIRQISNAILDNIGSKTSWEFIEGYAIPMPVAVISKQLGFSAAESNKVRAWSDAFTDRLSGMISEEREIECAHSVVEFQQAMKAQINKRRDKYYDDLLGDLVAASAEGEAPLTDAEILSVIQQLMVAGNETSTSTMAEGIKLLVQNPDQTSILRADPTLIPNTVEEILRLASPVAGSWRIATEDTVLHGYKIKKGSKVMVRFAAASRDPERFNSPDEMNIKRQNAKTHFAFGRGIHTCLGNMLARREIAICVEHMLERYSHIEIGGTNADLTYSPNVMLRGLAFFHIETTQNTSILEIDL